MNNKNHKSNDDEEAITGKEQPDLKQFQSASNLITKKLGLENIEYFSAKSFFSEAFKKHERGDIENLFSVGSPLTTPQLHADMALLPNPWIFFRILGGLIVLFYCFQLIGTYAPPVALPPLLIIGSFAVPLSLLMLFFEINTPKNISMYRVIQLVLFGGCLSLFLTVFPTYPFSITPIMEESTKLATVLLALRYFPTTRYPYILNALLIGAAVGAGFEGFETAAYNIVATIEGESLRNSVVNWRALSALFSHILWTAISVAGYKIARKDNSNFSSTIISKRFLSLFGCSIGLHFIWNLLVPIPIIGFIVLLILGFIAWVIIISLVQSGLKEIEQLTETPVTP